MKISGEVDLALIISLGKLMVDQRALMLTMVSLLLNSIPSDVKRYILLPMLDRISKIILRCALFTIEIPLLQGDDLIQLCHHPLTLIDYLHLENKLLPSNDGSLSLCEGAAVTGNLEIMKWARQHEWPWNNTCGMAAKFGHLALLKWAWQEGAPLKPIALRMAAQATHGNTSRKIVIFRWLMTKRRLRGNVDGYYPAYEASKIGDLKLLKWLAGHSCFPDIGTLNIAVAEGHYHILEWGVTWYGKALALVNILDAAVIGNKVGVLQWILSNSHEATIEPDQWIVSLLLATELGHFEIMKWLHEQHLVPD